MNYPAYMNPNHKLQQYRVRIRKAEHEQFFRKARQAQIQHLLKLQNEKYDSQDLRKQILYSASRELTGEVKPEWKDTIQKLKEIYQYMPQDYDMWFNTGIIKSIVDTFRMEYVNVGLGPQCASLISDCICICQQKYPIFTARFLQYEPIQNLVSLLQLQVPLIMKSFVLRLLSNISAVNYKYRDMIFKAGGSSMLVEIGRWIKDNCQNPNDIKRWLDDSSGFLRVFTIDKTKRLPKQQFVLLMVPLISYHLLHATHPSITKQCLLLLNEILNCDRHNITVNVYKQYMLVQKLLELLEHQQFQIRFKAMTAIGNLTVTDNSEIGIVLVREGLLDRVLNSVSIGDTSSKAKFMEYLFESLTNVLVDGPQNRDAFLNHPILQLLIANLHHKTTVNVQAAAIGCLKMLIQEEKFRACNILMSKCNLIEILVESLHMMISKSAQGAGQLFCVFQMMIIIYNSVYEDHVVKNKVLHALESVYNFSSLLSEVYHNHHNKMIAAGAGKLIDLIAHIQMEK